MLDNKDIIAAKPPVGVVADEKKLTAGDAPDPWAHRSIGMRCRTCMWFVEKAGTSKGVGRCRRHAPTLDGYPVVFADDWCGDHKLNENAI